MALAAKNMERDILTYPISLNYGKQGWNAVSALREFLSNMLDTNAGYSIEWKNGVAAICDEGGGLPRKSFIFGESTRGDSQIGQFGEGAKMAFITLLREGRKVRVSTKGFDVEVRAVDSEEYESRIMEVEFVPSAKTNGTDIYVECTEEELKQAKALFVKIVEPTRLDTGIYSPGGSIYVLGLKTTELPDVLFSYDIPDKSMSNRDRNIVDTAKLQDNLIKLLQQAKNQKLIQLYLSGFQTRSTAYEYQLSFLPLRDKMETWKKALEKLYPKGCLSSDMKSDLHAHAMGYTVLRNVPQNLLQIFKTLGLKDSSVFAANYKGEAIQQKNRLVYPMSETYVNDWTRIDAIREFVANALDAGDPRIVHNGKEGRISDSGDGIMKKHLVLGSSGKAGQSGTIGKFGEGLKMAFLVLARTGSPVKIESVGTTYTAKLEYNEEFETKLLVVEYAKNGRTKGSSIVFECAEDELEKAKTRFLQFKGIRKKPIEAAGQALSVYPEGTGAVYVNGLETVKVNGMFDYDVSDKAILNSRDRNGVDTQMLRSKISEFLRRTGDDAIIEKMMTMWKTKKDVIEYEMSIAPAVIAPWTKWAKKLYPKAVFASGSYNESDFVAKQAGYELLANIPYFIRHVLEKSGVKSSESVAQQHRKGILFSDRIVYPITAEYASGWNVQKALQELISNAIDADSKCKIEKSGDKLFVVSDKGEGISARNFLFGDTSKTQGDQKIGMFGEGLKMAALVFARAKREFKVVSGGTQYEAKIERDNQFRADVLVIYLTPSRKKTGTDIFVEASEWEVNSAKNQFLLFNSAYKEVENGIHETKSTKFVFVNGFAMQRIEALYSYNLTDKTVANRDRSTVDMEKAKKIVARSWASVKNKSLIEAYLTNTNGSKLESEISFTPVSSVMNAWKDVMKKVYDKTCFATGTDHDGVARDKGFKLLGMVPQNLALLLRACGMKNSQEVVTLRGDEKVVKKRSSEEELSASGKKRWAKAKAIFGKLYGLRLANKIEIVAEFHQNPMDGITLGMYEGATDKIYILKDLIENETRYPMGDLIGTMIHEQVHRITGAADRTREFEAGLTRELGRFAMMLRV